jgi:hypothetical protein
LDCNKSIEAFRIRHYTIRFDTLVPCFIIGGVGDGDEADAVRPRNVCDVNHALF